jgi:hypothetical protein
MPSKHRVWTMRSRALRRPSAIVVHQGALA